jgi:PAP_fibrillin
LTTKEFADIWEKAAKFPDVEGAVTERIDVDSFVQIYRDIDDMFEDEEESPKPAPAAAATVAPASSPPAAEQKKEAAQPAPTTPMAAVTKTEATATATAASSEVKVVQEEPGDQYMEEELESVFRTLCDKGGYVSKETLLEWDEVDTLIKDGLVSMEEFISIWEQTQKSPGSPNQLDVDGFLSFNVALDDLFQFDGNEQDEEDDEADVSEDVDEQAAAAKADTMTDDKKVVENKASKESKQEKMVEGDDMTADELFDALSKDGLIDTRGLQRWGELRDMLDDGDLTIDELQEILDSIPPAKEDSDKFDKAGFMQFYKAIDDLFEEDDDDDAPTTNSKAATKKAAASAVVSAKDDLLELLEDLNDNDELLPCGLDSSEKEQKEVLKLVQSMEGEPTNLIKARQGAIDLSDLAGTWELLYSSSSAMRFNKGLSGLGGSVPNGRFGGVKQVLKSDDFLTDMEYQERIEVTPSTASFDVRVTGDWELRSSTSLFTGDPSIVLIVVPDRVVYGPTSTRADHWKSLGPLNMLDVAYLDDNLRVMRGNTSTDSIFIWRRISN